MPPTAPWVGGCWLVFEPASRVWQASGDSGCRHAAPARTPGCRAVSGSEERLACVEPRRQSNRTNDGSSPALHYGDSTNSRRTGSVWTMYQLVPFPSPTRPLGATLTVTGTSTPWGLSRVGG